MSSHQPTSLLTGPDLLAGKPTSTAALRDLRRNACSTVLHNLAGHPFRVARYALIKPGQDPADRLSQSLSFTGNGCQTMVTAWDDTGMTDPSTRPQLARLYDAIECGRVHGIVAPSRTDISNFNSVYEDALAAIRRRGGCLVLIRDETTL
jgi:hypothetical protein